MPGDGTSCQIGNVGSGSSIQQGKYLSHFTVNVKNGAEAEAFYRNVQIEQASRSYKGPLLRPLGTTCTG